MHALGRFVGRHPRTVVAAWVLLVLAGFALAVGGLAGQTLFQRLGSGNPEVPGQAQRADDLLTRTSPTGGSVLLVLDRVAASSAPARAAAGQAADAARRVPGVAQVSGPVPATDGRALLVSAALDRGLGQAAADRTRAELTSTFRRAAAGLPGAVAGVSSQSALVSEITGQVEKDLQAGEGIALPLSLVVMVGVFGGFLAAGLPIVGAVAAIAGALASLLAFSYAITLDASVVNVVTILGLGLSIDYGLLLASRYREELRRPPVDHGDRTRAQVRARRKRVPDEALEATMGSAGRTVAFSAVTVALSLCGLLFFDAPILRAIGAAGVSVVLVALAVALTLVPALLTLAGRRMIRPGLPQRAPGLRRLLGRFGDVAPPLGVFSRLAGRVQRRPVAALVAVLVVLGVAAAPVGQIRLVSSGIELLPRSSANRQVFEAVQNRFPGSATPAIQVVSRARPAVLDAWLARVVPQLPGGARAGPALEHSAPELSIASAPVSLSVPASSDAARQSVLDLRQRAAGRGAPAGTLVTGESARLADFVGSLTARAPIAIGLVVLATFVLLFLMTGSVLVPVKALLANLVSLGASFGVLVWVFQDGHLEGLLGFTSAGGVETTIPALVLAFGFGLAMDYELFLLSRVLELRREGVGNDEAVRLGLQRSGRIITSAALIIVVVFAGFVSGKLLVIKETGVALAVAVLVDATLVRLVLVPATMTLLGEWNWWAPAPLRRLHTRFALRE